MKASLKSATLRKSSGASWNLFIVCPTLRRPFKLSRNCTRLGCLILWICSRALTRFRTLGAQSSFQSCSTDPTVEIVTSAEKLYLSRKDRILISSFRALLLISCHSHSSEIGSLATTPVTLTVLSSLLRD